MTWVSQRESRLQDRSLTIFERMHVVAHVWVSTKRVGSPQPMMGVSGIMTSEAPMAHCSLCDNEANILWRYDRTSRPSFIFFQIAALRIQRGSPQPWYRLLAFASSAITARGE